MAEFEIMKHELEETGLYDIVPESIVYAELKAYAEGLDLYFSEAEELIRECFIAAAQSFGLTLREELVQRINLLNTAAGRRAALIKAFSISAEDGTAEGMIRLAESFNAHGSFAYDQAQSKLTFTCTDTVTEGDKALMQAQMAKFAPVWAAFEIV